ncbi:cytidine deaminase [Embleya sp. NBC_00896]|uniref:cytidine deaminase family protein n=1 Tax=Embleya sp. NBC_00896 TaxID=2975961 RepID=UPI002F90EA27|nr:cytidine deaminase [Embleya sp. NBC_00896]
MDNREGRDDVNNADPHIGTLDHELVEAAAQVASTACRGDDHTMAAAARTRDGLIFTAVNVYHFTGGPCAELVVIGTAAAQGTSALDTIVAVGDRGRGVVSPCGRCRQVLLDYYPKVKVIVSDGGRLRTVAIGELLPASYVWADNQGDEG